MTCDIGFDHYWSAFDLSIIEKDANGIPQFSLDQEKYTTIVEKLVSYFNDAVYVYDTTEGGTGDVDQDWVTAMFADNRMLFSQLRILHTDQLRDMESDYALIPLPKYNEEQENYHTFVHDQYSIVGIPLSVQNPAMASAVLEAMAAESYRHVSPAYYDLVLNGKYIRDPNSAEMLDIAMAGIKIDFGWIYSAKLGGISSQLLRNVVKSRSANVASTLKAREKQMNVLLTKLVENVEKIAVDH